ncbi:MAG: Gmad2 immunoglobulin-like domain-containing protein [Candidatus Magasanikbacteria bacterium]
MYTAQLLILAMIIIIGIVSIPAFKIKQEEFKRTGKHPKGHYMSLGIAIGIAIGIPFGIAIGNIALGPALGLPIGVALGASLEKKHEKDLRSMTKKEIDLKKKMMLVLLGLFILGIVVFFFLSKNLIQSSIDSDDSSTILTFSDCVEAENPIMESYPRSCSHGRETFTENIGNELEKADSIRIDSPRPNTGISSPLQITGQARGVWYFEGDAPVILTDWDGKIIAEGYITAQDEWMTEEFVPFKGELHFEVPALYDRGTLILQKDNPSDLPKYDDALEIPIFFEK